MTPRIIARPAFEIIGAKTFIGGPDNEQFGRFWEQCRADGRLQAVQHSSGHAAGPQTGGVVLGVSRVEADPAKRDFYYMIAVETAAGRMQGDLSGQGMERYTVPACTWAVFACRGAIPDALVAAEMFAFLEWLPASGYQHALAPEMEVYPATNEPYCEFWLPICPKEETLSA